MKTFKSPDDLHKLSENHPAHATVKELIERKRPRIGTYQFTQ